MSFRLIFEIEPPREPDLKKVMRQVEIFGPIVDGFIIPDNHLGLPAMSSMAIAQEVTREGFKVIVGLNARDRNMVRFESDLLTMKTFGIEEVLFLYGDPISEGRSQLTVKKMLSSPLGQGIRRGALATIGKPLGWRRDADFLLTKLAFGRAKAGYWREAQGFSHTLYCGVIALPDLAMARRILNNIPDLTLPAGYLEAFEGDGEAGFRAAIDELDELYRSGIDGAQLVVPSGRRRFAEMLESWKGSRGLSGSKT